MMVMSLPFSNQHICLSSSIVGGDSILLKIFLLRTFKQALQGEGFLPWLCGHCAGPVEEDICERARSMSQGLPIELQLCANCALCEGLHAVSIS